MSKSHFYWAQVPACVVAVLVSRLPGQDESAVTFACRVHYAVGFTVQSLLTTSGLRLPLLLSVLAATVLTVEAVLAQDIQTAANKKLKALLGAAHQQLKLCYVLFTRWCRPHKSAFSETENPTV